MTGVVIRIAGVALECRESVPAIDLVPFQLAAGLQTEKHFGPDETEELVALSVPYVEAVLTPDSAAAWRDAWKRLSRAEIVLVSNTVADLLNAGDIELLDP